MVYDLNSANLFLFDRIYPDGATVYHSQRQPPSASLQCSGRHTASPLLLERESTNQRAFIIITISSPIVTEIEISRSEYSFCVAIPAIRCNRQFSSLVLHSLLTLHHYHHLIFLSPSRLFFSFKGATTV
jgi:hypothetical protein